MHRCLAKCDHHRLGVIRFAGHQRVQPRGLVDGFLKLAGPSGSLTLASPRLSLMASALLGSGVFGLDIKHKSTRFPRAITRLLNFATGNRHAEPRVTVGDERV